MFNYCRSIFLNPKKIHRKFANWTVAFRCERTLYFLRLHFLKSNIPVKKYSISINMHPDLEPNLRWWRHMWVGLSIFYGRHEMALRGEKKNGRERKLEEISSVSFAKTVFYFRFWRFQSQNRLKVFDTVGTNILGQILLSCFIKRPSILCLQHHA